MHFYPTERVGLFIDGANLYATARSLNFDIDYRKLLDYFRSQAKLIRANYYTAMMEEADYSPIRPLVDWLDYNGFSVVTKPTKEFTDSAGRRKIKGNMDIEIAVDIMELASELDHVVLFSGDGDFRRLVEATQRKGLRVTVVSTLKTKPPMVADDLRRQTDVFVEIMSLSDQIGRAGGQRKQRPQETQPDTVEDDAEYDQNDDGQDDFEEFADI
ncbi:MAG: NYN domain-containing protein [Rhizobiales bacterium]|nr:NYN domain-containing protein [Hyphomicrobiales bacterium]